MKKVSVTPLKSVNGVSFGSSRSTVRKEFGKFKEFKKSKTSVNTTDDFGWCHVFYDATDKMIAVELFAKECNIVVGSTNVDLTSLALAKKSMNMNGDTDEARSISIGMSDGKVGSVVFGKRDYFKNEPKKDDKETKTEAAEGMGVPEELPAPKEEDGGLMQFYDDLKAHHGRIEHHGPKMMSVGGPNMLHNPGADLWRSKAFKQADCLRNNCHRHFLVDLYCKISPLDKDYIDGHQGQMAQDVDSMLANKGMSATQYLTSCYEATKAPFVQYLLHAGDLAAQQYLKEAEETLKDAQDQGIEVPEPKAPDVEDKEINDLLVDVKKDTEYEGFVDSLKQKTIKKIVNDVSKLIADKKEEQNMTFDTTSPAEKAEQAAQTESVVSVALDYIQGKMIKESIELSEDAYESALGYAIREATLNQFDTVFEQKDGTFNAYSNRINFGHGYVLNEAVAKQFVESAKH